MSRRFGHRLPVLLAAVLAATLVPLGGSPTATAALDPNTSIFIYRSGVGVTGIVHAGIFTQNSVITTNMAGWTAAAVTRDTLLLYNSSSGKGAIATFTAGHLPAAGLTTITGLGTGYALAAGSCDTVLLYNRNSGKTLLLKVSAGAITGRKTITLHKNFFRADASCDTVSFWLPSSSSTGYTVRVSGTLRGGSYAQKETSAGPAGKIFETHSSDTFLFLSNVIATLATGTSAGGHETFVQQQETIHSFDRVAGTEESVLLYDSTTGFTQVGRLTAGTFQSSYTTTIDPGWKIIVGGR